LTVKGVPLYNYSPWSKMEEETIMRIKLWGDLSILFDQDLSKKKEKGKTIIYFKRMILSKYSNEPPHLGSIDGINTGMPTTWKIF
jgi:hypothetical protein